MDARTIILLLSALAMVPAAADESAERVTRMITENIGKKDYASLAEGIHLIDVSHALLKPEAIRDLLQSAIVIADDKFFDQGKADEVVLAALAVSQRTLAIPIQWEVLKASLWNESLPGRSGRPEPERSGFDHRLMHEVAALYKAILGEVDPHFDWNRPIYLNVKPPAATGLPAGVAPEAIEDQGLRAQYRKAIDENQRNIAQFDQQDEIKRQRADVVENVADWVKLQPKSALPGMKHELVGKEIPDADIKSMVPEDAAGNQ